MNDSCSEWVSGQRRWFHFAYFNQARDERRLDPHQTRDALAALCLETRIKEFGVHFADQIFNYPSASATDEIQVDNSFLGKGDLLDDAHEGIRRRMQRSRTTLERKCSRASGGTWRIAPARKSSSQNGTLVRRRKSR